MRKSFALLLLCVTCAAAVSVAPARAAGAATPTRSFTLVGQPASVGPGDTLALRLRITPASTNGLDVRVRMHNHIETRSGFEETVAGRQLGRAIDTADVSLDKAPLANGVVTARFGMPDANLPGSQTLHPNSEPPGVYPLEVELRADGVPVDHFVTWLVYVPAAGQGAIAEPLSFVWVWSVVAPPAHESDGTTPDPDVLSEMLPGGRLERIASLLATARRGKVPLTLDISPETLQSWLDFAQERQQLDPGATALRVAASNSGNQLLAEPYVPIDLPAFEAAGFGPYLTDELLAGSDTLRALTGVRQDTRTVSVDPVNDAAIGRLRNLLFDRVLVREERLPPRQPQPTLTAARPFLLSAPGNATIDAASTNPTVAGWLNGPEPPALRAQRFLAGLSLIAVEAPNKPRGIVVAAPRNWTPDSTAVAAVLSGLRHDPLLRAVTLNDYFVKVPRDTDPDRGDALLVRQLPPIKPTAYPISALEYEHTRRSLSSFRGVIGSKDRSIARGEQALLLALSSALTPARAHQELAVVDRAAASFLSLISITQQRVTLTARRVKIPLTFSNKTAQAVKVRVLLAAPSGKALFPDGAEQLVTLAPGNQTIRFLVAARATGTFAMTVTLTSEDGQLPIGAPTEISVRSTVFSGWGAMLTVGALVFLAGWWANHIWRGRRALRRAAE